MNQHPDERPIAGEAVVVSGMVVIVGSCLFEWLVISPDHPAHALLRVLAAGVAASLVMALLRGR